MVLRSGFTAAHNLASFTFYTEHCKKKKKNNAKKQQQKKKTNSILIRWWYTVTIVSLCMLVKTVIKVNRHCRMVIKIQDTGRLQFCCQSQSRSVSACISQRLSGGWRKYQESQPHRAFPDSHQGKAVPPEKWCSHHPMLNFWQMSTISGKTGCNAKWALC